MTSNITHDGVNVDVMSQAVCPSNDCIFTNARKLNTLQKWEISDASEDSELENANHPSGNQTSLLASEVQIACNLQWADFRENGFKQASHCLTGNAPTIES